LNVLARLVTRFGSNHKIHGHDVPSRTAKNCIRILHPYIRNEHRCCIWTIGWRKRDRHIHDITHSSSLIRHPNIHRDEKEYAGIHCIHLRRCARQPHRQDKVRIRCRLHHDVTLAHCIQRSGYVHHVWQHWACYTNAHRRIQNKSESGKR